MDYDIVIIKEFNIGEFVLPFRFDISKIQAFPKQNVISEKYKYKGNISKSWLKQRLYQYIYLDELEIDADNEFLEDYTVLDDYEIVKGKLIIKSPEMLFNILTDHIGDLNSLVKLRNFIDENEINIMRIFLERVENYLNYSDDKDMTGNSNTHVLMSLIGDTTINPTPFFSENLNQAIYDWSWREVQLRAIYKSKTFKIENAIQIEKNRLEKQALDDAKKGR